MWWPRLLAKQPKRVSCLSLITLRAVYPLPSSPSSSPAPYLNSTDHGIKTKRNRKRSLKLQMPSEMALKLRHRGLLTGKCYLFMTEVCKFRMPRVTEDTSSVLPHLVCANLCAKKWVRDTFPQGSAQQGPLSSRVCRSLCGTLLPPDGTAPSPALGSW